MLSLRGGRRGILVNSARNLCKAPQARDRPLARPQPTAAGPSTRRCGSSARSSKRHKRHHSHHRKHAKHGGRAPDERTSSHCRSSWSPALPVSWRWAPRRAGLGAAGCRAKRFLHRAAPKHPPPRRPKGRSKAPAGWRSRAAHLYVSDYYHRARRRFTPRRRLRLARSPCRAGRSTGLGDQRRSTASAASPQVPAGRSTRNEWHEGVLRLLPSERRLRRSANRPASRSTKRANVYVDDRTHVAVYEPSGAPVDGRRPNRCRVGEGALGDGYGVAVAADGERVYVADAASDTVKVFEPASDPSTPVASDRPARAASPRSPTPRWRSTRPTGTCWSSTTPSPASCTPLRRSTSSTPSGAYLGKLTGAPGLRRPAAASPSTPTGTLYVTDGDSEKSNVSLLPLRRRHLGGAGEPRGPGGRHVRQSAAARPPRPRAPRPPPPPPRSPGRPHPAPPSLPPPPRATAAAVDARSCRRARSASRSPAASPRPACRATAPRR